MRFEVDKHQYGAPRIPISLLLATSYSKGYTHDEEGEFMFQYYNNKLKLQVQDHYFMLDTIPYGYLTSASGCVY
jgi:hypothetical protein